MIHARMQSESPDRRSDSASLTLQCPSCCRNLVGIPFDNSLYAIALPTCPRCSFWIRNEHGIWMALTPERELRYRKFMKDYERIRSLEGYLSGIRKPKPSCTSRRTRSLANP